jgi:hypothetical protein
MVKGNWQRRAEIAVERRKTQKTKKLRKEQRAHFKTLVQHQLWPLLDKIKLVEEKEGVSSSGSDSAASTLPTTIHLWVDSVPLSRKRHQHSDDQVELEMMDDSHHASSSKKLGRKGNGTRNKARGEASANVVNKKAVHPRSHGNNLEETTEEEVPLLCRDYFFKGSCPSLTGTNNGSKSKKNHCKCNFEHYISNKELTLASAVKSKSTMDIDRDEYIGEILKRSSKAAIVMQKRLNGEDVPEDGVSFVDEVSGIDMVYHIQVPLVSSSSSSSMVMDDLKITDQISKVFSRENIPISSIAYVVCNHELIFDRCDKNGIVLTTRGQERLLLGGGETKDIILPSTTGNSSTATSCVDHIDHFSCLPSHLLEHILTFLPGAFSIILPGLNKILNKEIGTRSPFLWKHLLDRESWPEPPTSGMQDDEDAILSYKTAFISHFRVCHQVEYLKLSVEKILGLDDHGHGHPSLCKSIAMGPLSNDLLVGDNIDDNFVCMWSDTRVLVASKHDCRFYLFDVSFQDASNDCRLREVMNVRIAPVPLSKKVNCKLTKLLVDEDNVLCSFSVDDTSILASIAKEDLLANSTEDSITPFLKVYDAPSLFEFFCDEYRDRTLMDLTLRELDDGRPFSRLIVDVLDLIACGKKCFCVLAGITVLDGVGDELMDTYQGIISLPLGKNDGYITDFIQFPDEVFDHFNLGVCTNYDWKRRLDPTEIVCKNSANGNVFIVKINKEGVFDYESQFTFDNTIHHDLILPPRHSGHTLWTPSCIVTSALIQGKIVISKFFQGNLFRYCVEGNYDRFFSMNQLGNDHLLLTSLGSTVDIHRLAIDDIDLHETSKYFHLIILHVPNMEEIYHSAIVGNNLLNCDVLVGTVRKLSIPLIVGERTVCLSNPLLISAHKVKENQSETASPKLKLTKKKKSVASGKKDGFARGMSLRG